MRFRLFPKLSDTLPEAVDTEGSWFALEKIHGAQLVVGVDSAGTLSIGKRKAWLGDADAFFGWQLIRGELARGARAVREQLMRDGVADERADVVLYGELFGGGYPHPDVAPLRAFTPVQTGIWYAPDLRYAVFAVLAAASGAPDGTVLGVAETLRVAAAAGFAAPPLVGRGSRIEMLQLPTRYASRVAGDLGLPAIRGNVAEGFVARLDRRTSLEGLVAFKRKIPEMREANFDGATAFDPGRRLALSDLEALLPGVVNRARVESAGSKTGYADERALLQELELDVRIDLEAVLPLTLQSLDAAADRRLSEAIRARAVEQLRGR